MPDRPSLLSTMVALKKCKEQGGDYADLEVELTGRLRRFSGMISHIMRGESVNYEDIVGAAARSIVANIIAFEGESERSAGSYCWKAVRNATLSFWRREHRHRQRELLGDDEDFSGTFGASRRTSDPEQAVERHELARHLNQAMARLPPRDREVLVLTVVEDRRIVDISDGSPGHQNMIAVRKRRALRRLAALLPADVIAAYAPVLMKGGGSKASAKKTASEKSRPGKKEKKNVVRSAAASQITPGKRKVRS